MCFNGGECVHRELCDCSRFKASGSRCQTVHNTGAERDNICRTWGQYHFETFDGLYYYFSGKSTYVLVRQNEIDEQSFSIQVNNDPECKSSPYSCKRSVSLFFSGDEEIKLSSEVIYKGFGVQLPRAIGNVYIQKLAGYILVRHRYAFTLAWDGTSAVYIKLTPDYLGKSHGLCGNNNAILQDELETSYVITCEEHLIYNECIDCCPVSCQQKTQCIDSELPCVDGCYCPDGLIYENELCVKPTECPCDYHGNSYRTGSVVHEECNNCPQATLTWTWSHNCFWFSVFHPLPSQGCVGEGNHSLLNILLGSGRAKSASVSSSSGSHNLGAECSVSGDINFMTFDGRKYTFQATCQYILAKSHRSGKFTVSLQNAPCGPNQDGSCIQSVNLILNQDPKRQVTLTHSGDVLIYDQYKISLPYSDDSFEIRKLSSVFLQVKTNTGLQILYDRQGLRLYLQVDDRWKDDTVGLCGTFNGNMQDDFLSPVGVPESTPQLFGNSWKTSSACAPGYDHSPMDPCDIHLQAASYAAEACSIVTKELFAPCHTYLSPVSYFEQCRRDTCKCGQICLCSALANYAHQCRRHGVIIDFRSSIPDCVHNCPAGQIYVNCSNPQANMEFSRERTCENQLLNLTFSGHLPCLSGCVCPQGLVKHGDACFEPDECPCSWKGKEYFPGDKVISSCHTCICQHGSFQCIFHPCPSMCTAYGDRHYRTFDGLTFDFIGACKVHLVKSTSITSFSVITENVNCFNTGIICRKYISINVGKSFITFDDDTGNPSPSSYIDKLQKIHLWKAGFFTLVHFPNEHITILWDQRTTIHIQTGPQWQCVDSSDIRNPCSLNPLREPFAKKECGILLSEMFEACHPVVDVTWFYSNCLTDTCGCNQGGDCECFCTSVSAYAHQCCQHGVVVDWRSPRVCLLGKGPYKLVSYLDGEVAMAAKLLGGYVFPVRAEDFVPGDAVSFMLTSGWYKPKAHDPTLVSFETADRPNYFLHLASNDTLLLSKWEDSEEFRNRSTFAVHKNTWLPGYSSFESFAKPGFFIHLSASSVDLLKYKHSEKFRLSTLFKLVVLTTTISPNVSAYSAGATSSGKSTIAMSVSPKSNISFPSVLDVFPSTTTATTEISTGIQVMSSITAKVLSATEPQTVTTTHAVTKITDTEGKPISTFILTGTSSIIRVTESPVATTAISETSEIDTTIRPTVETKRKPEKTTAPSFVSATEQTTTYFTKYTMSPSLETPSYAPTANETRTSEGTKPSTKQTSPTIANVTETSFSPLITTLFTLKPPMTSETTKGKVGLTKEEIKTTFFPLSTHPVPLLHVTQSVTETPTYMVQNLTGTVGVFLATTHGAKIATLQTKEMSSLSSSSSSGITGFLFTTGKKEIIQATTSVEQPSSSYFSPYSLYSSSATTAKPSTLPTKRPSLSDISAASPALAESKETLQTASTTEYPPFIVLNMTETLTTVYTKYPVSSQTARAIPLTTKVTSKITGPYELSAEPTTFSQRTSSEYKSPLFLNTTKMSIAPYTIRMTSATKTTALAKEIMDLVPTIPWVTKQLESMRTTLVTESPYTLLNETETTRMIVHPDEAQTEKIASVHTRKPTTFASSPASSLTPFTTLLPLSTFRKEISTTATSSMSASSEATVTMTITLYPRTSVVKSTFSTEGKTPHLTASTLSTIEEQPSSLISPSPVELPAKVTLNITDATLSPYSEFSSRLITSKKVTAVKERSTLPTSVTPPFTKSPDIFPATQYVAETSVSPYILTQKIPKEPATTKHPVQTETVSTVSKPTVKTVRETVKQTASTTQISLIKDYSSSATTSVGTSSVQTSSAEMVSPQIREESAIPRFTTKLTTEHVPSTSKPYLASKKSTTIYQPPTEILTTTVHPKGLFSTTESIGEFTTLYPFVTTSRPAVDLSTLSPTSVVPAKVLLTTEKESSLTDAVLLTYVSGTASALQTKLPTSTRKKMDLTVSTRPLSFLTKVITTSSPVATMKKEFPSFPTQKSDSSFKSTKQTAVTEPLVSSQTPTVSIAVFPLSKLTSPSLILSETSETPITTEKESLAGALLTPVVSTASTSMGKSATEKTVVLSKQVPLSTTSYGSTFPAGTVLPATTRSSTTTTVLAPSSVSSVTAQNTTIASATSGKTAAIREALTTSLFSGKPIYFSVASKTEKAITSETAEPAGPVLVTQPQSLHTPGITDLITPTLKTTQMFHSPYFTNITAVPPKLGVSVLSTIYSSSEQKTASSSVAASGTTIQTPKRATLAITEVHTPSKSSSLMMPTHSNATMAASVPPFAYLSTQSLYESATEYSGGLTTAEAISGVTASVFMPARETATLQTCVPITENECIKHICLDGQLIQVNKSQNCPYNATQPSCGVLGLAVQINGDKCCPKWECACRCTFFSDLSFVTFDGNHLALFKEAAYIVSQTQDETITIHILDCRNTNMGHLNLTSLCLAMLNLTYLSNQIIVDRLNRKITVNSRYAWPTVRKYGFKIEDTGFMYVIETPTNIRIQWFHSTGVMIIESNTTSEPKALGLCGFCDGSSANDLMLPNRTVLSKTDAPSNFIDSWQVPSTLKYVGEDRHQETNCSVMDCSNCFSLVMNQTFSSCHPYTIPLCAIDLQTVVYFKCFISLLAFPCSEDTSYQACIAACDIPRTCQNGEPTPQDSESCSVLTEGCVCSEGTTLHRVHAGLCIPEEKCACTDSSGAPHAVGEIWKTSLSGCCMHKCVDNETIIPVEYNCSDAHDLDCQRFGEVALIVPDDQTCCPQKICKCDPSKCEPVEQSQTCREDQTLIAARVEGTCCISYICECACDTIAKPQCKLGEKLQIDDQFQNSTENVCGCIKYKCVRDKVCLTNERGVLRPGQTVVEHTPDGICHTSYCTNMIDPSTKYYRINISWINCVIKCEAGFNVWEQGSGGGNEDATHLLYGREAQRSLIVMGGDFITSLGCPPWIPVLLSACTGVTSRRAATTEDG
ncbi:Otogelin [Chelonia mydas]|uniref:Otogelin n=1 Tax=Chelonia mydas TaxID=8469 RepID=M7CC25_CHEMY|nr:Otogelin [Chelonia mydas]